MIILLRSTYIAIFATLCVFLLGVWYAANAQDTNKVAEQQKAINELMQKIEADPKNLDNYFQYAKIAEALGEHEKAARAYQTMLKLDPNLDRVRLDLGAIYVRQQKLEEAKALFQQVLDRDPPDQVRKNIEMVLKNVKENGVGHKTGGFIQFGFVSDSNANSAPGSGSVTVFDTNLPLEGTGLSQGDVSMMITGGVTHRYRFAPDSEKRQWDWNSSITGFQTHQQDQSRLNLQLISVRTGPSVVLPELKATVNLSGTASVIALNEDHYLDIYNAELSVNKVITPKFSIEPEVSFEYRDFHNSPTIRTYEDRTGPAYQIGLNARYLLTEKDMIDANVSWRNEATTKVYYDNQQWAANLGHTHLFEGGYFTSARAGFRRSLYEGPDTFISRKTRADLERYGQITVGKNFDNNINTSLTYMYRDVDSNLQNYAYDNHRLMATVGWRF